ncbi:MAG: hypothetical protein M9894_27100 [Planctomycetes bacterium]|nr:hypothetical protein [Planctomycetota bacterium]
MRKIKTKGLKIKMKPVDRGPRFSIALHGTQSPAKAKEALLRTFDINEALADVVVSSAPVVICRDLDQDIAADYVKRLKSTGDFRVWLESASGRMKQMNLKQKSGSPAPIPVPEIRKH